MSNPQISAGQSPFEAIKQTDEAGNEYWSARDIAKLLGYKPASWHNFERVIDSAQVACELSNNEVSDHFYATVKMVSLGSKTRLILISSLKWTHLWIAANYAHYERLIKQPQMT